MANKMTALLLLFVIIVIFIVLTSTCLYYTLPNIQMEIIKNLNS